MVGTLDTTTDLYVCMSINEYYSSIRLFPPSGLGGGGWVLSFRVQGGGESRGGERGSSIHYHTLPFCFNKKMEKKRINYIRS